MEPAGALTLFNHEGMIRSYTDRPSLIQSSADPDEPVVKTTSYSSFVTSGVVIVVL